jgi:hypothetical protein
MREVLRASRRFIPMNEPAFVGGIVAAIVIGWLMKAFFPGYLDQKGRISLPKEDVAEITSKIEQVKAAVGLRGSGFFRPNRR